MAMPLRDALFAACDTALLAATLCLSGCGAGSAVHTIASARPPSVVGSIIPNAAYELDGFDIQGNYAYVLADNQTQGPSAAQFSVVDIANPASMAVVSTTPLIGYINYGEAGIRVQGKYLYLESSTGTASTNLLQIYDVSNPLTPAFVGSVQLPLYSLALWVSGNYAYAVSFVDGSPYSNASPGALSIVDVSNPASPTIVGSANTGTPGVHVADIKVVGSYAYVSGQSTDDDPPLSHVLIFNVANPTAPYLVSSLVAGHSPQGLDVEGSFWYQTIYDPPTPAGDTTLLNIYNIANPSARRTSPSQGPLPTWPATQAPP